MTKIVCLHHFNFINYNKFKGQFFPLFKKKFKKTKPLRTLLQLEMFGKDQIEIRDCLDMHNDVAEYKMVYLISVAS